MKRKIEFFKMSGNGNDFILIDNRDKIIGDDDPADFAKTICKRKISVGADGLILIESSDEADFKWRFFNSDGSFATMCGNGARCAAKFAFICGIAKKNMVFKTGAGLIHAKVEENLVKIKMTDPKFTGQGKIETSFGILDFVGFDTGVPHVVVIADDIEKLDVKKLGREIRYHEKFSPHGTNVNFAAQKDGKTIINRTYERGVEDETLACGTGCVAAALAFSKKSGISSPAAIIPKSKNPLRIHFERGNPGFFNVFLEGDARTVYRGEIWEDAFCFGK